MEVELAENPPEQHGVLAVPEQGDVLTCSDCLFFSTAAAVMCAGGVACLLVYRYCVHDMSRTALVLLASGILYVAGGCLIFLTLAVRYTCPRLLWPSAEV